MTICSQVGEIYATIDCTDDGENGFPRLRVGHQTLWGWRKEPLALSWLRANSKAECPPLGE
jgi:hypothetical protein